MKHKIVTVSREFGSGGRTIGKEVASRLGIPCYDQELIEKVAERSGFSKDYIAEHGEYAKGSWLGSSIGRDYLWGAQSRTILDLAKEGSCVFVGRCADSILRGRHDLLTVFIHADLKTRAERIVKIYGEREEAPEKRLRDKDKRRAAYYRYYTDMEWGLAKNYDISLDSGKLGIEKCIELIVGLY